jgi:hypothetical protein
VAPTEGSLGLRVSVRVDCLWLLTIGYLWRLCVSIICGLMTIGYLWAFLCVSIICGLVTIGYLWASVYVSIICALLTIGCLWAFVCVNCFCVTDNEVSVGVCECESFVHYCQQGMCEHLWVRELFVRYCR